MYNIWCLMKKKYFENWKLKKQLVFIMKLKIFCWITDNIKYISIWSWTNEKEISLELVVKNIFKEFGWILWQAMIGWNLWQAMIFHSNSISFYCNHDKVYVTSELFLIIGLITDVRVVLKLIQSVKNIKWIFFF